MKFSLKSIKMAGGDETPRFEAKIVREDGKVAAIVHNEGCGGCDFYRYTDASLEAEFLAFIAEWNAKQPEPWDNEAEDMWCAEQLDVYEERKTLMRWAKKYTCFRLKGDDKEGWRRLNRPTTAETIAQMRAKYGEQIETIFDPAVAS